ncbi:MAG: type I-B CRISPR-associated protein Cas7/Cst2/DevR [Brevinematales bacterium]
MPNFKDITVTIIFEGSALNRDEKIGGNIQSIKKLTIGDKVVSFISRPAIRHYLFNTMVKKFKWQKAKVRLAKKDVIQFDITQSNILNCEELDAFGYMYTIGDISLTRKAPVGITKAIALFPYNQDMALYSNHDLVNRGREQGLDNVEPDLNNREENLSLYKLSFTIDSRCLGEDIFIVDKYENNEAKIHYKDGEENKELKIQVNGVSEDISGSSKKKLKITISDEEKKKRICQILTAIHDGLVAHSSGEDNTIVPLFMIAAPVKVPSPVFHPYIDIVIEDGKPKVIGIKDCIQNSWVEDQPLPNGKSKVKKVYIKDCERLKVIKDDIKEQIFNNWEEFLKACGLEKSDCEQKEVQSQNQKEGVN